MNEKLSCDLSTVPKDKWSIFYVIAHTLKENGRQEEFEEFCEKAKLARHAGDVIKIADEYVTMKF
jgi:hypothetical protein